MEPTNQSELRKEKVASDDLAIIIGPYPYAPDHQGVFLQNQNTARGTVAAIRVEGDDPLQVAFMDRSSQHQRWPLRFEVRVPPGSRTLLGLHVLSVWKTWHTGTSQDNPGYGDFNNVNQHYVVEGAYYQDPPYPPFNSAETYLRVYSFSIVPGQINARVGDVVMNLHSSLPVTALVLPVSEPALAARKFTVPPGGQLHISESERPITWTVKSAEFPANLLNETRESRSC